MKKGYLILENGKVFEGIRYDDSKTEPVGELVFNTGMTGYLESVTDPSYYGQMLIQTFPLIGNYGVIPQDFESSKIHLKAYIINKLCELPSNFRSTGKLGDYLKEQDTPVLLLKDTRNLTKIVREQGVMNAIISSTPHLPKEKMEKLKKYTIKDAVSAVTSSKMKNHPAYTDSRNESGTSHGNHQVNKKILLIDFGTKANIIRELNKRGCDVILTSADITINEIEDIKPDGIMLSNGPGDPAENTGVIEELKKICKKGIPVFGICLGHQLLALANGASTEKMTYGHRGANQPVMNVNTKRVYITSQNHGYCVDEKSLPRNAAQLFKNVNDNTCEGIEYHNFPGFSVQFHPEACGGPLDMNYLFDDFMDLIEEVNINA